MRCDTTALKGTPGLAIRLEVVKSALTHPLDMLERAIIEGGFGRKDVTKEFLLEEFVDSNVTKLKRGVNSKKMKCWMIWKSSINSATWKDLQIGKE